MSAPPTVPDTTFGFTQSELNILRQQQQVVAQQRTQNSNMPDRGRGTSRQSQASSRAASAASSQSYNGRIVLDRNSLASLQAALDNLVRQINGRISQLEEATELSVQSSRDGAHRTIEAADDEIKRMKRMMQEMDRLEEKCEEIKHVRDVIKQLRARVESAGDKLDRLQPNHGVQGGRHTIPRR